MQEWPLWAQLVVAFPGGCAGAILGWYGVDYLVKRTSPKGD